MKTRQMTGTDLAMVLGWARAEGWNPGLSDAAAFLAADPAGFFLAEVDGAPAAAISVVNHDDAHAFLGLYICLPAFRGRGIGFSLWREALAHAGGRSVTLDGVPTQQENYRRSGFRALGKTVRFKGVLPLDDNRCEQTAEIEALVAADARAVGHGRPGFARAWFKGTADRIAYRSRLPLGGFAVIRHCADGHKIGPFHAADEAEALVLLTGRPLGDDSTPLYIDVPEDCAAMTSLLQDRGFSPVFETARMVRGTSADGAPPAYYAVATLELG